MVWCLEEIEKEDNRNTTDRIFSYNNRKYTSGRQAQIDQINHVIFFYDLEFLDTSWNNIVQTYSGQLLVLIWKCYR